MSAKIRIKGTVAMIAPSTTPRTDMELERICDLGDRQKISQSEWAAWKLLLAWARKLEVEFATDETQNRCLKNEFSKCQ